MGSWGCGPLENDEAVDWLCALEALITQTIDGKGPRGSKGDSAIDEKIAAIHVITSLELKPNFTKFGTCPLGYKFPNMRIVDVALKALNKIRIQIKKDDNCYANEKSVDDLQDKIETIKNKLIAEHL